MTHRWMKFWPQDWQRDPALRMCSLAARGLWIELICVMHDAEPYGHLVLNGRQPSPKQIGSMLGVVERDVLRLIGELEDAGVLSRTDAGVIFSRRMVRDKAASETGRANGKRGGNPALKADAAITDKTGGNDGGLTPPIMFQEAEAETEKKEERTTSLRSVDAVPSSIDARTELFRTGLSEVRRMTGLTDGRARSLLGKCLKAAEDDASAVSMAIARCADTRPANAVPWLLQACEKPQFRNGFLAVIADEGWSSQPDDEPEPPNPFLIGSAAHGPH